MKENCIEKKVLSKNYFNIGITISLDQKWNLGIKFQFEFTGHFHLSKTSLKFCVFKNL